MLEDYREWVYPFEFSADDPGERSRLKARAHKLKGTAGMLGAADIKRLAGAAEAGFEQNRPTSVLRDIFAKLAAALSALEAEARDIGADRSPESAPLETAGESPLSVAEYNELFELIDHQNLEALDRFRLLEAKLASMIGEPRFTCLRDAVENLDFPLAARLLKESRPESPAPAGIAAAR